MKLSRTAHRVRVPGFQFAGVRCGLKKQGPDVALIVADRPAVAAGMFTSNHVFAAPVAVSRERVGRGKARAVLVNAGNANACTGREGRRTVEVSTALVAERIGCAPADVLACSTGRIGVQIPHDKLLPGVERAVAALAPSGFPDAANAILTTDAFPKTVVKRLRLGGHTVTLAVMGKGAGMIAPDLATLLVFATTDANLSLRSARTALATAVADSFNAITVDGDMSTNDTVMLLASGAAGGKRIAPDSADHRRFAAALRDALTQIACDCVRDGEGAGKLVEVVVRGAKTPFDAQRVARAVASSVLCKAAFAGSDPNWGRFCCAAGTAGVPVDAERMDVIIGGVIVSKRGTPIAAALPKARARMEKSEFQIVLDLHQGRATGRMFTSDLTVEYVHFNAAYTT